MEGASGFEVDGGFELGTVADDEVRRAIHLDSIFVMLFIAFGSDVAVDHIPGVVGQCRDIVVHYLEFRNGLLCRLDLLCVTVPFALDVIDRSCKRRKHCLTIARTHTLVYNVGSEVDAGGSA